MYLCIKGLESIRVGHPCYCAEGNGVPKSLRYGYMLRFGYEHAYLRVYGKPVHAVPEDVPSHPSPH